MSTKTIFATHIQPGMQVFHSDEYHIVKAVRIRDGIVTVVTSIGGHVSFMEKLPVRVIAN